ncbi:MAG: cyanophycin synthetase [Elusimicrobiota bacterium]
MDYNFQIEQLKSALEELGSPHLSIPVVTVSGTNGKGSAAVMLNDILSASSKKTGLYTSPHIFDFTERIKINQAAISKKRFRKILGEIRDAEKISGAQLTKFETVTCAAIKYFSDERCDISVMETGLGGRLDATNVCENKLLSLVTPISVEHTQYLGSTIEEIALEKAGIIKKESIVVDYSGSEIISNRGSESGSKVYRLGTDWYVDDIHPLEYGNYSFTLIFGDYRIEDIVLSLKGRHQCYNAAAALTAALALGFRDTDIIKKAVSNSRNSGRMEMFSLPEDRTFVVDAAHNPAGMEKVKDFIEEWKPEKSRLHIIIGVYKDKDYAKMAEIIKPLADYVWVLKPESERGLDAMALADIFGKNCKAVNSYNEAQSNALSTMHPGDWLVACGSFSIVRHALNAVGL